MWLGILPGLSLLACLFWMDEMRNELKWCAEGKGSADAGEIQGVCASEDCVLSEGTRREGR
jgi:hypothetical protein